MFTKILISTDGSKDALHAAQLAAGLAQLSGAKITVLNGFNIASVIAGITPDALDCSTVVVSAGEDAQKDILRRTSDLLRGEGVSCRTRGELGHPVEVTLRIAEEEAADLIVLGSHGQSGFGKLLLGSVSEGVVRHAHCPVLIVREQTRTIGRLLVAIDGSERSYKALEAAKQLAQPFHAHISVLNVLDSARPFPGIDPADTDALGYALRIRKEVTEHVAETLNETGIENRVCQEKGHPAEVITAFADTDRADVIVLGSHGLGAFQRLFLGSVSHAVLLHTGCSVLIVR